MSCNLYFWKYNTHFAELSVYNILVIYKLLSLNPLCKAESSCLTIDPPSLEIRPKRCCKRISMTWATSTIHHTCCSFFLYFLPFCLSFRTKLFQVLFCSNTFPRLSGSTPHPPPLPDALSVFLLQRTEDTTETKAASIPAEPAGRREGVREMERRVVIKMMLREKEWGQRVRWTGVWGYDRAKKKMKATECEREEEEGTGRQRWMLDKERLTQAEDVDAIYLKVKRWQMRDAQCWFW